MKVWFEGEGPVACTSARLAAAMTRPSEFFLGFLTRMPGISQADVVEEGDGFVTIRTNEGLMKRTAIHVQRDDGLTRIEFDEAYGDPAKVIVTSHYRQEFQQTEEGLIHRLVISGVGAPGVLGLLYRTFGSGNIGRAVLESTRQYLEQPRE